MEQVKNDEYIFCFALNTLKIGLLIKDVHRLIRAVEVTPLPGSPSIVSGIINVGGKIIPVIDFRKKFNLKSKAISPSDTIVIVNSESMNLCFFTEEVIGLRTFNEDSFSPSDVIIPESENLVKGVAVIENEIILIHDINKFLSLVEEKQLKKALKNLE